MPGAGGVVSAVRDLFGDNGGVTVATDAPCGASTVYRKDSARERVRVPALHLVADQGCTCQACLAHVAAAALPAAVQGART